MLVLHYEFSLTIAEDRTLRWGIFGVLHEIAVIFAVNSIEYRC
jgi:hypothetical protein